MRRSIRKNGSIAVIVAVVALTAYFLIAPLITGRPYVTRYVAYIGRYSNHLDSIPIERQPKNPFDRMHETALRAYLATLNNELHGVRLELKPLDNQRDPHVSDSLYRNVIAPDSNIVLVVDNTWGEHLLPCAETIRENAIPVISMNADRNGADYGKGVLFIGNDDDTPRDISAFLGKALVADSVIFISETDYPLHDVYLNTFASEGIQVVQQFNLAGKTAPSEAGPDSVLNSLSRYFASHLDANRIPIVVNAHVKWGSRIIEFLDSALHDATVIGHVMMVDISRTANLGQNGNQIIVLTRPSDALSRKISNDLDAFRLTHPTDFESPSAPFFIKRCSDVLEIIRGASALLDSTDVTKNTFTTYLSGLRNSVAAGEQDIYRFDSNLLVKDIYFTRYHNQRFYSFPVQLNSRRRIIPNLFFGVDILDIYDIDVNTNTFKSDFFYWVKVDTSHRDAEKYIIFQNIQQNQSSRELVIEKTDEDIVYRLYKVSGTFHHDFELRSFPMDQQEIAIKVEILDPADRLKISFDQSSLDQDKKIFERFNVRAWNKLKYYVTIDNRIASTMRGDPDNSEGELTVFKNFAFRLLVRRKFGGPFLEIILPLTLIGFVSIALLYVKDISFENLGEVSVGTFLGVITFSIALSYVTPNSDYLTKADLLFWLTFMVVLMSFMTIIVVNSRFRLHELEGVSIRPIRHILSILYPIAIIGILWLY